jgi:hypothetical protein
MAAKSGTTLNLLFNSSTRAGAPLFPFLFLIGRHTISQFQSPKKRSPDEDTGQGYGV